MKKLKYITANDISSLEKFLIKEKDDFFQLSELGWNTKQIKNQLNKINNFSICHYVNQIINGILIGETIKNTNGLDLEIHLIYVSKDKRREKIATNLLNYIKYHKDKTNISNIYLEVSEDNEIAINFYEKNDFVFLRFRHNYYKYNNKISRAKCYQKKI